MLDICSEGNAVLLPVKIVPGASRTRLVGLWQDRAKIAVACPPEKGKANQAVVSLLAELLGVRKHDISVVSGQRSPIKTIRIEGVTADAVRATLNLDRP